MVVKSLSGCLCCMLLYPPKALPQSGQHVKQKFTQSINKPGPLTITCIDVVHATVTPAIGRAFKSGQNVEKQERKKTEMSFRICFWSHLQLFKEIPKISEEMDEFNQRFQVLGSMLLRFLLTQNINIPFQNMGIFSPRSNFEHSVLFVKILFKKCSFLLQYSISLLFLLSTLLVLPTFL